MILYKYTLYALCSLLLLTACSDSSDSPEGQRPELALSVAPAPVDLSGINVRFSTDVPYGPYERNLFDIFLPDCDEPSGEELNSFLLRHIR